MTLTSDFSLHTETLKRDCPNVFDCKSYDTILHYSVNPAALVAAFLGDNEFII
jgi:hypothetical protein